MTAKSNAEAIHDFLNSFGLTAFDENTVPDINSGNLPQNYITYSYAEPPTFADEAIISLSLWYRNTYSWGDITAKCDFIKNTIGMRGAILDVKNGVLRVKRGSPFAQRMADESDSVRRIYINLDVEFYINN